MKYCRHCGKEIMDEAVICPGCGCATEIAINYANVTASENDKISIGLCILAIFVPLFGVIYWPLKHKEAPKRAKACGICGIVSWVISFIFNILIFIFIGVAASL